MFEIILPIILGVILFVYYWKIKPSKPAVVEPKKVRVEEVNRHAIYILDGYCATGDPTERDQLLPAASARLETTKSDDIIYLGVNPLTTGSESTGMYIDLKELLVAVEGIQRLIKGNTAS